jgi:hypothetical protein
MELNLTKLVTLKFLAINVIAIAIAAVVSYFAIFPIASKHLFFWVAVLPMTSFFASLIQLQFIQSLVSKKGEWVGFNVVASIVWPLATVLVNFAIASILKMSQINLLLQPVESISTRRILFIIIGAIPGAIASSIIAVGHWHQLQADNEIKTKWITSVVITMSAVSGFAAYAFSFMELAK